MKKNTFRILALVLLACFAMMGFAGCGDQPDTPDPTNPTESPVEQYIELNQSQITLDKANDCTLLANVVGISDAVVWTSSDETVATVENGKVVALAVGEAEITATAGAFSAKCTVVVVDNGVVPAMSDFDGELELLKGKNLDAAPVILFAGSEKDSADAQLTYTVADPSVATIDEDGIITALKVGTTTFTVSGSFRGIEMLPIEGTIVVKSDILITMNNLEVNIYASNPDGSYATQSQLAGAVYINGQLKEDATLVWGTEDASLVAVDNGLVTAKRAGSTKVTVTYTADDGEVVKVSINVNVQRPVVKLDGLVEFDLSDANGTSTMDLGEYASFVNGKFTGFYDITKSNREEIAGASYNGKLSLPNSSLTKHGNRRYALESDVISIEFDALAITKKIYNFEDLASIAVSGNVLDGYYVLADDIYCNGQHVHLVGTWTDQTTTGFIGTFDGRGHIIDGFNGESNRGLFYCTGAGVIKNVAFTNATGTVVLANGEIHGTTFENIFVSGSATYLNAATWNDTTYKNVIFMSTAEGAQLFGTGGNGNLTITNFFTVGSTIRGYWNSASVETNAKFFANNDALVEALGAEGELDLWTNSLFSVENGKLLFNGKVVYQAKATLAGPTMIIRGSSETYTSNGTVALKTPISGVSIANGVLSVDASVLADTVITLVATINNDPASAVELEVLVSVVYEQIDLTGKGSLGDLETSEANSYLTLPGEITGTVTGVSFGGVYAATSAVDGKVVVPKAVVTAIYNACGYEEQSLQIYTADDKCYTVKAFVVTKAIGTFDELKSIATGGNVLDGYYVLTADIDCAGKNVYLVNGGNKPEQGFVGVFDGRGHAIDRFETAWGLFYSLGQGVVKNIAFTNTIGDRPVLANTEVHGTTIENIFIGGEAKHLSFGLWDGASVKNIILASSNPSASLNTTGSTTVVTYTNVFVIGTELHGYMNEEPTLINTNVFANVNALLAAMSAEGELDKWAGSGFSMADGKLYFFGREVLAPTKVNVYEEIDMTAKGNLGDLETTEDYSYITLPAEIEGNVTGISVAGSDPFTDVSVANGKLAVAKASIASIYSAVGYGDQNILLHTDSGKNYSVTVTVVTKAIGTFEELKSIATKTTFLDGYYVLNADIDCAGKNVYLVYGGNSTSSGFVGTLDGRGHAIDNFNTEWGLFYALGKCVVKNIAFTNTIGDRPVLANSDVHGATIENIFVGGEAKHLVFGLWHEAKLKNIVFASSNSEASINTAGDSVITFTNVFAVGAKLHDGLKVEPTLSNTNVFANKSALLAAMSAEGELDKWTGSGFSVEDGKLLFFGRVVIE